VKLWDFGICVKKLAAFLLKECKKRAEEFNHYKDLYRDCDDRTLERKYKTSSGLKKAAIGALLRERGITPETE